MPDPRCQLSAQELTYAATALRAESYRASQQADDPQFESSRAIFEGTAKTYGELAGKLTRIAEAVSASAVVANPRPRQGPQPAPGKPRQGR